MQRMPYGMEKIRFDAPILAEYLDVKQIQFRSTIKPLELTRHLAKTPWRTKSATLFPRV